MVTANPTPKDERIAARLSRDQKDLIEQAARLRGLSVSDFVVSTAWEAARQTVDDARVLRLSYDESVRLMEALNAAPRPIPALRAAGRRRREVVLD